MRYPVSERHDIRKLNRSKSLEPIFILINDDGEIFLINRFIMELSDIGDNYLLRLTDQVNGEIGYYSTTKDFAKASRTSKDCSLIFEMNNSTKYCQDSRTDCWITSRDNIASKSDMEQHYGEFDLIKDIDDNYYLYAKE